jgi:hypothetical protein
MVKIYVLEKLPKKLKRNEEKKKDKKKIFSITVFDPTSLHSPVQLVTI